MSREHGARTRTVGNRGELGLELGLNIINDVIHHIAIV